MGAFTLCPHLPFDFHSISSHPIILDPYWYEGPWMNKVASYAVYPRSIVLDDDNQHLHLSIGYQDRDMYAVKRHIDKLLRSLVIAGNCTATSKRYHYYVLFLYLFKNYIENKLKRSLTHIQSIVFQSKN